MTSRQTVRGGDSAAAGRSNRWVALAFGSLLLLGGRLSDLFGRKRLFIIGVAGFGLASAVGAPRSC